MNKQEILNTLSKFPYDRNEYWVITGEAMVLYDIRKQTADIDLGCSGQLADRLEADGYLFRRTDDGKIWFRYGEDMEVFEDWAAGTTETVCGFRIISIRDLIAMKQALGRDKDKTDVNPLHPNDKAVMGGASA